MQLHIARLCLDCNEVHDAQHCPVCGSEALAYLTRWIPVSERRGRTRPASSPKADAYRDLISGPSSAPQRSQVLKRSALGLTVIAVAGWVWQWNQGRKGAVTSPPSKPTSGG